MAASRYASDTEVSTDRSIGEIRRTLRNYGAAGFAFGENEKGAMIEFVAHDRRVRFVLPMPNPRADEFTKTPTGKDRAPTQANQLYETACKRVYRVFVLVIKAQLEAVESGLVRFEDAFLPYTVLPGGMTVADTIRDRVDEAYRTNTVPELLPDYRRAIEGGQR